MRKGFQYPTPLKKKHVHSRDSISGRHSTASRSREAGRSRSPLPTAKSVGALPPSRRMDDGDDKIGFNQRPCVRRDPGNPEPSRSMPPPPPTPPSQPSPRKSSPSTIASQTSSRVPSPTKSMDRMESIRSFASHSTAAELDAICGSRRNLYRRSQHYRDGNESIYSLGSERSLRSDRSLRSQGSSLRSRRRRPDNPLAADLMDVESVQSSCPTVSSGDDRSYSMTNTSVDTSAAVTSPVFVNAAEQEPLLFLSQASASPPRKKPKSPFTNNGSRGGGGSGGNKSRFFSFRRSSLT